MNDRIPIGTRVEFPTKDIFGNPVTARGVIRAYHDLRNCTEMVIRLDRDSAQETGSGYAALNLHYIREGEWNTVRIIERSKPDET